MNLFLFPESANLNSGYGMAVNFDYKKLAPQEKDIVVWYTNSEDIPYKRPSDIIINKPPLFSFIRILNLLMNRPTLEIPRSKLSFLKDKHIDTVYCDDIIFYRAIRYFFPDKLLVFRFHNCFARIGDRRKLLNIKLDLRYKIIINQFTKLERVVFKDKNTRKIFISNEDKDYYTLMTTRYLDAEVWPYTIEQEKVKRCNRQKLDKIVWLGGVSSHKKKSGTSGSIVETR